MKKIDLVNVRLGTDNVPRLSNGNIYPVLGYPHGMTSFCPQTDAGGWNWFYNPRHTGFEGLRLTHQPSPWVGDYGHLRFLPTSQEISKDIATTWSSYRPSECVMTPAYYSFDLLRYRIKLEATATERGGAMRMTYKESNRIKRLYVFFYDESSTARIEGNTVIGYTDAQSLWGFKGGMREYFRLDFSEQVKEFGLIDGGMYVEFDACVVEAYLTTSYISEEQLAVTYDREMGAKDFDTLRTELEDVWEDKLSAIEVEDGNLERIKMFYSCMYRALLYPRKFYEVDADGKPYHMTECYGVKAGVMYTDNGFWDTYRTVYPLLAIIDKEAYAEMCEGFVNFADDTGYLPKWLSPYEFGLMPGTLIEAVLADAVVKDIVDEKLARRALTYMLKNAETPSGNDRQGRTGCADYNRLGYVPRSYKECVNHTLDCAYGDYCIAQVASKLGEKEIADRYYKRSRNYANIFDPETGFMRGKDEAGERKADFDPYDWGGENCEGSSWQNSFAVYHDFEGLAKLYGGKDKLIAKLDELFSAEPKFNVGWYGFEIHEMSEMAAVDFGQCAISNQPSFHIPYIYSLLGAKDKTEYWVEKLVNEAFSCTATGFPGDEDNGTMAAWYVFSCLGYYPVCPGKNEYSYSKPLFDKITIR